MKSSQIQTNKTPEKNKMNNTISFMESYKKKIEKKQKKMNQLNKKIRGNKIDIQNKLFNLFDVKKHWKISELIKETQQPTAFLKQLLGEIANYNCSKEYKGYWILKEEYN